MRHLIGISALALLLTQCQSSKPKMESTSDMKAFDLNNLNTEVAPCDNFYEYAIGTWRKNNPIPSTESRWSSFNILAEENDARIQSILDESLLAENPAKGSYEQLIKDFYTAALDSNGRNRDGMGALLPVLEQIDRIQTESDVIAAFGSLKKYGVGTPISLYVGRDAMDSERHVIYAGQSGLSLGDKSYYLNEGEKFESIREAYTGYIEELFGLAEISSENVGQRILALETQIAEISWDRKDLRNADLTYNPTTIADLEEQMQGVAISRILEEMGFEGVNQVIVGPVSYFSEVGSLIQQTPPAAWKDYLKFKLVSGYASHINDAFESINFGFFSTQLRGVKEMRPRNERILRVVNRSLGEPIGKKFCEKHFPEASKAYMTELIENLRGAYRESINNLTWMGDSTKVKALKKLESFTYKIGYPDKWKDYSSLDITASSHLANIMHLREYRFEEMVAKLNKPVDKSEWYMSPQTVNAYYNRSGNEIVFPAGILQPPYFHPSFDHAINYGGIGAVIGHEFTHGFDDQGSKYDWDGNKNNWWTDADREAFKKLTKALGEQYSKYEVLPGEFVNGYLTMGENIADLGGITLSYMALEKLMKTEKTKNIDGFTWQQRFFLSWANVWKQNITDEALRNRILTDPHSPGEQRVLGTIVNLPQFEEAFRCSGHSMSKPEEDQIKIW